MNYVILINLYCNFFSYFRKHRFALLDTLFAAQADSKAINDDGIQEEVDTFVFTGHDTVSSAITYTLVCIAEHADVQEKLYDELKDAFSENIECDVNVSTNLTKIHSRKLRPSRTTVS